MAQIALDDDILERKFTDNFTYLQKKLSRITDIVDILIEKRVINLHDRPTYLNVHKPQKEKIDDVLQEVITKKKFGEFIFALRKTSQFAVIDTLTPNNKEFAEFIESPEKGAVSSLPKDFIGMKTKLEQQSHKIDELEAEKKRLQQDIDQLKNVQRGVRETLEKNASRIEMLKTENNEKKQLEEIVQQLQHDLDSSNEELKKKKEYVDMLEKQLKEDVESYKKLQEQIKEDRQQMKDDRKEREVDRKEREEDRTQREMDRKEREEDRKQRIIVTEQMKEDREQRDKDHKELNTKMDLVLSTLKNPDMEINKNKTIETKQQPIPKPNIASNLHKNHTNKKKKKSK